MTTISNFERRHRPLQAKGLSFEPRWKDNGSEGTTRSNTPDSAHYEAHAYDSYSDKDSRDNIESPKQPFKHHHDYSDYVDFIDQSGFEIE